MQEKNLLENKNYLSILNWNDARLFHLQWHEVKFDIDIWVDPP